MIQFRHFFFHRLRIFPVGCGEYMMQPSFAYAGCLKRYSKIGLFGFNAQVWTKIRKNLCGSIIQIEHAPVRRMVDFQVRMLDIDLSSKCLNKKLKDWFVLHRNGKTQAVAVISNASFLVVAIDANRAFAVNNTRKIGQYMRVCRHGHITRILSQRMWSEMLPFCKERALLIVTTPSLLLKARSVQRGYNWLKKSKLGRIIRHVASMKNRGENGESLSAINGNRHAIIAYGNEIASLNRTICNRFRKP